MEINHEILCTYRKGSYRTQEVYTHALLWSVQEIQCLLMIFLPLVQMLRSDFFFFCTDWISSVPYIRRAPTYFQLCTCYSSANRRITIYLFKQMYLTSTICKLCGKCRIMEDKIFAFKEHTFKYEDKGDFSRIHCLNLRSWKEYISAIISPPPHVLYIQLKSWCLIDCRTTRRASFMGTQPLPLHRAPLRRAPCLI